ncbi:Hypothetical predicted protein [Olea europaea subsp. europaea]|uniref:Uncharacterized protein n=1 Tax=Olea europaea subsp. europaea TaxID=158383 RepID=A0A8S0PQG9_OLEEU|nr:Hypothetical predicted protein [Olea europaea subsp. europaea]
MPSDGGGERTKSSAGVGDTIGGGSAGIGVGSAVGGGIGRDIVDVGACAIIAQTGVVGGYWIGVGDACGRGVVNGSANGETTNGGGTVGRSTSGGDGNAGGWDGLRTGFGGGCRVGLEVADWLGWKLV